MRRAVRRYRARPPVVVTPTITSRLFFGDYQSLQTGSGPSYVVHTYRHNNPRDPYETGVGGTCTGWNELTGIWKTYHVYASKIEVWGYNTCASPLLIVIGARNSQGLPLTSGTEVQQAKLERPDLYRGKEVVPYVTGNGIPSFRLSMYKTTSRLEGKRTLDDDYSAPTTGNPTKGTFWDVYMSCMDGTTSSVTCNYQVRITYWVRFSNRKFDAVTD